MQELFRNTATHRQSFSGLIKKVELLFKKPRVARQFYSAYNQEANGSQSSIWLAIIKRLFTLIIFSLPPHSIHPSKNEKKSTFLNRTD